MEWDTKQLLQWQRGFEMCVACMCLEWREGEFPAITVSLEDWLDSFNQGSRGRAPFCLRATPSPSFRSQVLAATMGVEQTCSTCPPEENKGCRREESWQPLDRNLLCWEIDMGWKGVKIRMAAESLCASWTRKNTLGPIIFAPRTWHNPDPDPWLSKSLPVWIKPVSG